MTERESDEVPTGVVGRDASGAALSGVGGLDLTQDVLAVLRERLPQVASETVAAVVELPGYTGALRGSMGENIQAAVQMALAGFLRLASGARDSDPSIPLAPTLDGAYALGRGEARSGRSMDALLAAYRVGARVSWRELSRAASDSGVGAETMAQFAGLVFAYIDQLSAASVAGHADELSTSGRVRERYRERLGQLLLAGAGADVLAAAAERADWGVPRTLTAVLLPVAQVRGAVAHLDRRTVQVAEDLPGLDPEDPEQPILLLVPDVRERDRPRLKRVLAGRSAVLGPTQPWQSARTSYLRAVRTLDLLGGPPWAGGRTAHAGRGQAPVDSEDHLPELVVGADPEAVADLRAAVLAPLATLRPGTAERLAETLRSWLLHQGRRDAVADDLHVHAQTVRYRMGQIRELYGDRLDDPRTVLELVLALTGSPTSPTSPTSPPSATSAGEVGVSPAEPVPASPGNPLGATGHDQGPTTPAEGPRDAST